MSNFWGAFQAGQSCITGGPQSYLICATGGAIVGGFVAYGLRPPKIVKKRMDVNMLNETMIQLILIAICCVYIIFNTKADKNPKRGYRTALYLFVMAGIISYIMNYLNWLDFFLLITPIMCLFKFEDKWS